MDDSDQDFAHICSKLLKRVRRKAAGDAAEAAPVRPEDRTVDPGKKRRKEKRVVRDAEPRRAEPSQGRRPEGDGDGGGGGGGPPVPAGSTTTVVSDPGGAGDPVEGSCRAKDAVLLRMQRFKRASPHMLVHGDGGDGVPEQPKVKDPLRPEPGPSDAALALQLQRDLDRQAAEAHDLEARGLFFCQLCHRDLSHMTPEGRAQHLNRCLDETECAPVVPPSSRVADCPICGKRFKSLKSRTAHLKRCSTDMGVAPAVLLQCLQRQAAEVQGDAGSHPRVAARGSKRKEPAEPSLPVMKRPRKKAQPLDEETMVALALSSSLLEREKELKREAAASLAVVAPWPRWRPEAGKGRKKAGKRRKGGPPRPPPLLLVQDPETALTRLQERPTRSPSKLHSDPGAACPLWRKSTLEDRDPHSPAQFYTPELRDLLMPREPPEKTMTSISKENLDPSIHSPVKADTQMTSAGSATLHPPAPSPSRSWAGTGRLSVGSQVLRDLMELAEEGRTLSQWLRDDTGSAAVASDLRLSGFVPEKSEENAKLCLSGFLPRDAPATSQPIRGSGRPRGCPESSGCEAVALSRLSSDLSSMVNNPQLSDVQVQVDSGEVYFVHSFMLYARCPLLAQMVHDSGFGVQEQGLPSTQRVLLGESPGEAVLALLQYLYTGLCPAPPASLLPALLELATRFDLEELQHLCQLYQKEAGAGPQEDAADTGQPWNNDSNSPGQEPARGDQDFMQLLRSMWNEEEGEEGEEATAGTYEDAVDRREVDGGGGGQQDRHLVSGDGEMPEECVNDEEMEEIYEFAATQRKLAEERDSMEQEEDAGSHADDDDEEEEEEEEEEVEEEPTSAEDNVFIKAGSPEHEETSVGFKADVPEQSSGSPAPSGLRYSRLFSGSSGVCEEFLASPQPSSPQPSTSWVPEATSTPPHRDSPSRASPRADRRATSSNRTCLQSSPSENPDLSSGPCFPCTPGLPLPGLSPGRDEGAVVADTSLRDGRPGNPPATDTGMSPKPRPQSQESHVPRRKRQPALPASPWRYKEPELIVLSDSSEEEMDRDPVPAASPGPSPPPPFPVWSQSHLQYTQIKPPPHPGPSTSPTARRTEEGGCDGGQGSACDGLDQSPDLLNPDQMGFSPGATPLQATHSTSSICTQTQSSMCRTRLFPRASASSSPPRASSSSWSSKGKAQTSGSRSPTDAPLAESSKNGSSVGESKESSFDARHTPVTISPPAQSTQPRPPGVTHLLCSSSEKSTPSRAYPRPYSSTPLHTDPPKPPVSLEPSLLPGDPEREELWRIHLSQSDPSDSVSPLSLCRDHSGPKGDADDGSSGRRRRMPAADCHHGNTSHSVDLSTVNSEKIQDANESESVAAVVVEEGEERGMESEGEHQQVSEPSFCQSFTDEPPMAFNDSWGLDAGGGEGHGGQALCFSLRLEDSGEVGSHQHSPISSHSLHPPLTPSHYPEGGQNPSASRSPGTLPTNHTLADPDTPPRGPEVNSSLLDPHLWDSWEEEEEEEERRDEALPLSQRVNPAAQFHTPVASRRRKRTSLVPITPMPSYSDMDTPELKNKLNRFGVRPLPKRQMILKLREIHQYTHQLVHSDQEEDGVAPLGGPGQTKPLSTTSSARPLSCAQTGAHFKRPRVPTGTSPVKLGCEDAEPLSSSQGSSTSSTAASEESAQ
ncbi:Structure-specific endonuclease subunit SLX4 [Merluccius polli]|uniref:Structure-specific endonuclease subunit SLX4 n=1 Tax=Merluccius polli TaxID=89951 RepID=A0AA47ML29_MERPO|nr:Structure-specific endonuclease subunit SLX4 [Merluccius polli]